MFVDVDPLTRNIDLGRVEAAITPRTRALMPVDLAGLPVDRDRLYDLAQRHGLRVIEDAAQSIGATWRGRRIGSFGDLVAFSFHANKNITTGEGGAWCCPTRRSPPTCEQLRLQGVVRSGDGRHGGRRAGRQVQSDRHRRAHRPGPAASASTSSPRAAARWRGATSSASTARSAASCRSRTSRTRNWHMFQVVLPPRAHRARRLHRGACASAASASACTIRRCTCSRCTARSAGAKATSRRPSASAARIVTLPLFPAMADTRRRPRLRRGRAKVLHQHERTDTSRSSSRSTTRRQGSPALFARLYPALDALGVSYEIIFVNDGSRDRSAAMLREQFERRPDVTRVMLFNGNFGQHMAIMAGFERARGDVVVTLDADLQNPPEEIGRLLAKMDEGYDYVGSIPPHAPGQRVPAHRLAADEPGARAHHATSA